MYKIIIVLLISTYLNLYGNIFNSSKEYKQFEIYLNESQKNTFEKVFDKFDKLIDSNDIKLQILKEQNKTTSKHYKKLQLEIQNLKKEKNLELNKLKKDIKNNPKRYLRKI